MTARARSDRREFTCRWTTGTWASVATSAGFRAYIDSSWWSRTFSGTASDWCRCGAAASLKRWLRSGSAHDVLECMAPVHSAAPCALRARPAGSSLSPEPPAPAAAATPKPVAAAATAPAAAEAEPVPSLTTTKTQTMMTIKPAKNSGHMLDRSSSVARSVWRTRALSISLTAAATAGTARHSGHPLCGGASACSHASMQCRWNRCSQASTVVPSRSMDARQIAQVSRPHGDDGGSAGEASASPIAQGCPAAVQLTHLATSAI